MRRRERQFVVTLVLSKLVTWMRRQPGTDQLRALVYFDEVMGFVPPTAAPPAKAPILTILKQARAFGVGLVLATKNPVDIDYKALSNAGTWMIGRLQTEQDKARLLDGLATASGGGDRASLSDTIAGLDKREFVLRQAGTDASVTFTSRWVMSYLRGPLTREQISALMVHRRAVAPPPAPVTTGPAAASGSATISEDATPVMPAIADGITVRWLDPAATWAAQVGAIPTSPRYAAAMVATVDLLFDDTKADLRHREQFEGVVFPLGDPPDATTVLAVDHDERDLLAEAPPGATYLLPDTDLKTKAVFTTVQRGLVDHLLASRTVTVLANPELKLYSRPGETEPEFAARCEAAADTAADQATAKVAARLEARIRRARDAAATAEDRATQAERALPVAAATSC